MLKTNSWFIFFLIITGLGTATTTLADDEPAGRRSSCKFPAQTMHRYTANDSFFIEKKKISSVGKLLNKNDVIFYIQLAPATKVAIPQDVIVNRDASPLNPNFDLEIGRKYSVPFTFSADGKNFYDMVYVKSGLIAESWIPAHPDGMLCSNTFNFRKGEAIDGGMPRIYQTMPLKFELIESPNTKARSIAITVKDIDAATVNLEISVISGDKVIRQKRESFDVLGGRVALGELSFDIVAHQKGIQVTGITEPLNYSEWLQSYLKMRKI